MKNLHFLIIDDNPNDRILSIRELKREFPNLSVTEITDEIQFYNALAAGNFDLVVTDFRLCWSDGLSVFRAVRKIYPECPVIMFTDSGNEEVAVEAMKSGLNDYVLKRQHFRRLTIAVLQCLDSQRIRIECAAALGQLRENQERFNLAQSATSLGVWDWDLPSNKITWNLNHELLFGISPGEFDGTYEMFLSCVHPEDRDLVNDAVIRAQENQIDYHQEFRVLWADGTVRWMADRGRFFYDASGNAVRAIGIILDTTHRKEREVGLQKYAEGLARAYRLQDEFLCVASHELRTPLNAVLGWAQLLRKYNFDEVTRNQRLEAIERNLKRQQQLIEQILDTSRLITGQMELMSSLVDLRAVVNSTIKSASLAAEAKSITLKSLVDGDLVQVLGDETKLRQIIWNLISNAIKFTPVGGYVEVKLEVITNNQQENNPLLPIPYAQITVSDTGQGISPEFLPYVFDQFRQEDSSRKRSHQGAGLGLTIVRLLVELHGGIIWAESPGVGRGATFTVQLPVFK